MTKAQQPAELRIPVPRSSPLDYPRVAPTDQGESERAAADTLRDFVTSGMVKNSRQSPMEEVMVLLRYIAPGQTDVALWAHDHIRAEILLTTSRVDGINYDWLSPLLTHVFNYLEAHDFHATADEWKHMPPAEYLRAAGGAHG